MKYRVGIIGSGSICNAHTYGYNKLNMLCNDADIEKTVICSPHITQKRADDLGWKEIETDWQNVVSRPDVDVVDISAYDYLHYAIAKAALENGKRVICEKPLADKYEDAAELVSLAKRKDINATVCTNYRYIHAIRCIKHLIDSGELGEIRHVYGSFTMNWAVNVHDGMNWRLDDRYSPGGVLADLGTHLIDMCTYFGLQFAEVCGMNEVYGKKRMSGDGLRTTTASELSVFGARFANGALGNFEVSRVSGGGGGMIVDIHGTKGNIRWEKMNFNNLLVNVRSITGGEWRYKSIPAVDILPSDYGWEHKFTQPDSFTLLFKDFFLNNGKAPSLQDGANCCKIVDAILTSDKERRYIDII